MNGKKILFAVFCACVLLCVPFGLTGCASTYGRGAGRAVIEHQKQLGEYQATVSYYLGRVDASAERIDAIRARAESLGGKIDETIRLFDEYQRAVEQLIRDYNALRNTVEKAAENNVVIDRNLLSLYRTESSRIHSVLQTHSCSPMAGYTDIECGG